MKDKNKIVNKLKHSIQIYYLYTNVLFFKIKNERKQDIKRQKTKAQKYEEMQRTRQKHKQRQNTRNKGKKHKQRKKTQTNAKTYTISTMMIELTQVAAWSFVSYWWQSLLVVAKNWKSPISQINQKRKKEIWNLSFKFVLFKLRMKCKLNPYKAIMIQSETK